MQSRPVHGYADLVQAIRERIAELRVTYGTVDDVSGLACGHTEKICNRRKSLADVSLPAILGALGLRLEISVDAEQFEVVRSRLTPSNHRRRTHWRRRQGTLFP